MNGNILNLWRYGKTDENAYGLMDDLHYAPHYNGNQLLRVEDAITTQAQEKGFVDGTNTGDDYEYDSNGNLIHDLNKGLGNNLTDNVGKITYNHLNLPEKVSKNVTDYIVYTYDATGRKLSQQVFGSETKTTDYVGELVYEGSLQFILHPEGRVVMAGPESEYQYFLKDHLGNTRAVFSEKNTTREYNATLEDNTQSEEQADFLNYSRTHVGYNHTPGPGYKYSQLLHAGYNAQVGLARSFDVNAGEMFDLEVYAKYTSITETPPGISGILNALITTFSLSQAGEGPLDGAQAHDAFSELFSSGHYIGPDDLEDSSAPKAFLNYILFDEDFNLADFGFDQISETANQNGQHDYLSLHVKVQQKGYLYIYLSNESGTLVDVFFDDLKIVHHTAVEQMNDYYPFGLTFNSYSRENSVPNRKKFNGIEEVTDLDLNVYTAFYRVGDPAIGRWWQIDPKVDDYYHVTPYNMMGNNPINITDPLGDEWKDPKNDAKVAAKITKGLDKANSKLEKQNTKLQSRIDKATVKGNADKANSLKQQKGDNTQRIAENNSTKDKLVKMADSKTVFTFKSIQGNEGATQATGGVVVMEVTNSLGNRAHEVEHGYNIGIRKKWDGQENYEIRAYQAQYSAEPGSMPPSTFTGTPSNYSEVTGSYVGGIMRTKTNKDGNTYEEPVYGETYNRYKAECEKKD